MPRPTLPRYLAKVPCHGGTLKVPAPPPTLAAKVQGMVVGGGTFSPAEGPRWGGKVDLWKVPWEPGWLFYCYLKLCLHGLIFKHPASTAFFKYFLVKIIALLFSLGSNRISFKLPLFVSDPMLCTCFDFGGETPLRAKFVINLLYNFDLLQYTAICLKLIKHGSS